jgi:cytochrome c oxidase subunit IV
MNNDEPVIPSGKSDVKLFAAVTAFIFIVSALFVMIDPCGYFQSRYIQFTGAMGMLLSMLAVIVILWFLAFVWRRMTLFPDRIVIKSRFRPDEILYHADMIGWDDDYQIDEGVTELTGLYISYPGRVVSVDSDLKEYRRYFVQQRYPRFTYDKSGVKAFLKGLGSLLLFGVFYIAVFKYPEYRRDSNKGRKTVWINNVTLAGRPEVHRDEDGSELKFKIAGNDELQFMTTDTAVISRYQEMTPALYTLNVEVLQSDYDVKIAHTRQPTFWDKHFDWPTIEIKSLMVGDRR